MRSSCRKNNKSGVVHAVPIDFEGMRVNRYSPIEVEAVRHKIILRNWCTVVGDARVRSGVRGLIDEDKAAFAKDRSFANVTVVVRFISLLCYLHIASAYKLHCIQASVLEFKVRTQAPGFCCSPRIDVSSCAPVGIELLT